LPRKSNWIERNWKWTVPSLVLVSLLVMALFFGGIAKIIKSSGAYTGAVAIAQSDPLVISILGEPVCEVFS
jgi:predicted membrane-bound dolichyl-phosphate-mannose-protein mannosyltransferase